MLLSLLTLRSSLTYAVLAATISNLPLPLPTRYDAGRRSSKVKVLWDGDCGGPLGVASSGSVAGDGSGVAWFAFEFAVTSSTLEEALLGLWAVEALRFLEIVSSKGGSYTALVNQYRYLVAVH